MKHILVICLVLLSVSRAQKWGVVGSWTPDCDSSLRFYEGSEKMWFDTRNEATYYVEQNGSKDSTYLLLYREREEETTWLYAKMDIVSRSENETQMAIRGLPEYFD